MGFLASPQVLERSATDLIGQYVGHTGPKVQNLLDKALGRVLFVDEAYRLADGRFAKEAMDEIVDSVTKDKYAKKLIIILAGYEKDINRLMNMNSGLTSRFPQVIEFRALQPQECIKLLLQELKAQQARLATKKVVLDVSILETPASDFSESLLKLFNQLSQQENWASARDVKTVAKEIFGKTIKDEEGIANGYLTIRQDVVEGELRQMLQERTSRSTNVTSSMPSFLDAVPPVFEPPPGAQPPKMATTTTTMTEKQTSANPPPGQDDNDDEPKKGPPARSEAAEPRDARGATRDAGVSDEVWEQLQQDRRAEEEREQEYQDLLRAQREARDADRERIVRRLLEEEARRKREAEARKKLETMGCCPMGYQWIKQDGGYRCAGGSHFMSDSAVNGM